MLGVIDPFMLAPTSGARFLGGLLVLLEFLVLLEILVLLVFLETIVFLEILVLLEILVFLVLLENKKSLWPKPEALISNV